MNFNKAIDFMKRGKEVRHEGITYKFDEGIICYLLTKKDMWLTASVTKNMIDSLSWYVVEEIIPKNISLIEHRYLVEAALLGIRQPGKIPVYLESSLKKSLKEFERYVTCFEFSKAALLLSRLKDIFGEELMGG